MSLNPSKSLLKAKQLDADNAKIYYTWTDEAPSLATLSWLPIVQAYTATAGISIETADISLAGRILSAFSDTLPSAQQVPDHLAMLGDLATQPQANIIKLPNISASVPQLKGAIKELQDSGYDIPDHPDNPDNAQQQDIRSRYDSVKGLRG